MPEITGANAENIKSSYYSKTGALMIVLCNITDEDQKDTVILDLGKFHFKNPVFTLYDPVPGKYELFTPERKDHQAVIPINITPTVYKVIFVEEK
jgi:hypothetical protein